MLYYSENRVAELPEITDRRQVTSCCALLFWRVNVYSLSFPSSSSLLLLHGGTCIAAGLISMRCGDRCDNRRKQQQIKPKTKTKKKKREGLLFFSAAQLSSVNRPTCNFKLHRPLPRRPWAPVVRRSLGSITTSRSECTSYLYVGVGTYIQAGATASRKHSSISRYVMAARLASHRVYVLQERDGKGIHQMRSEYARERDDSTTKTKGVILKANAAVVMVIVVCEQWVVVATDGSGPQ